MNDNTCKHNWASSDGRERCVMPRGHFGPCKSANGRQAPIATYPTRPSQLRVDTTEHPVGLVIDTELDAWIDEYTP